MEGQELVAEYKEILKKALSTLDEEEINILSEAVDGDPGFVESMVQILAEVS